MICLINVTIHKVNVHLPLFYFTFCWLAVQGISICTGPGGEIKPFVLHQVLRHRLWSEVIVVICYLFPIKTSLWQDNWDCSYELGRAGRIRDTIYFPLFWSRSTGQRRAHFNLEWYTEQPLCAIICDACFYNLCLVIFSLGFLLKLLTFSCPQRL